MEKSLLEELRKFISSNYEEYPVFANYAQTSEETPKKTEYKKISCDSHLEYPDYFGLGLKDFVTLNINQETFSECLLKLIDKKEMTDSQVYQKAMIDRRLFSKIRSNTNYHPRKRTVFAFIIALGLDLSEAGHLLGLAGYAFNKADISDLIVLFFINKKINDINAVNQALTNFGLLTLGALE
jgi:hypothetical protein